MTFPETPGKIPGNSESTKLRKEFGTTFLLGYHGFNILLLHGFYFHIICQYLSIKQAEINGALFSLRDQPNATTPRIFRRLYALYSEISDYNETFWSKYLLTLWLSLGSINVMMLYSSFYSDMNVMFRIFFVYVLSMLISFFTFILLSAAKINNQSIVSYKLLSSLYLSLCKSNSTGNLVLRKTRSLKIKVMLSGSIIPPVIELIE